MDLTSILQATHARKATTPVVAAAAEWVSSTSFPGRSKDLVMTIAKKPRVQMKMSNSVSEASTAVTQGIPITLIVKLLLGTQPPPPSSPWSHLVCERALIPLKAIIIKIPFKTSPTPSHHNPPDPECIPSHCVTPNGNKNREIAEEIRRREEGGGEGLLASEKEASAYSSSKGRSVVILSFLHALSR